ncbi:3557_t:CDS:1, partial [Paraglomus occultum]
PLPQNKSRNTTAGKIAKDRLKLDTKCLGVGSGMMKTDGSSEQWTKEATNPLSPKRKLPGSPTISENKRRKIMPEDLKEIGNIGPGKDRKKKTSCTSADDGLRLNDSKKKAAESEDQASGNKVSPISTPSASTTPPLPHPITPPLPRTSDRPGLRDSQKGVMEGEMSKNSPQNLGGRVEDEVDFDFWFSDFEPTSDKAVEVGLSECLEEGEVVEPVRLPVEEVSVADLETE